LKDLAQELSPNTSWIDAPAIVARRVAELWASMTDGPSGHESKAIGTEMTTYYLSDKTESFLELAKKTFGIQADWETLVLS